MGLLKENSLKFLILAHQTAVRIGVPNKANIIAVFENLDVRKYYDDIDGVIYPRDNVDLDYGLNDYVDQYRDPKLLYKEYVGEEVLKTFRSYTDLKNKYLFQVIDLRFQFDHIIPRKIQLHQEYRGATNNASLFMILIRHRENKLKSGGKRITEVTGI